MGDGGDLVGRGEGVVVIGDAVWNVVACVATVAIGVGGNDSRMTKVEDTVTSFVIPDTFMIYSSGLNVDVSTSNDQILDLFVPGMTVTVPLDPENWLLCSFCVGLKEDE